MTNFKNFVVRKGLEVAESIKLNGKTVTSLIDSGGATVLTTSLIDSSYVQARQTTPVPAFTKVSISGQGDVVADADAALPNWASGTQQQKLTSSDAATGDKLGQQLDISGDGNYALAAAPSKNSSQGAVYVFLKSGSTWAQQAKLTASVQNNDQFGIGSRISEDGSTVVIGARNGGSGINGTGEAYIFTRSGTTWSQQAKLTASDAADGDVFGAGVDISDDGNTVVIGAYGEATGGSAAGSAYVFTRSGSTWTQQQKIQSSDIEAGDNFGISVSISGNGTTIVGGAPSEDSTGNNGAGAAYIFYYNGSTWAQQAKITAGTRAANQSFGLSTDISTDGNTVAVGSQEDIGGTDTGAAYIFTRSGSTWSQEAIIQDANKAANDNFGANYFGRGLSLSGSGNILVAGASGDDDNGSNSGSTFVFTRSGSTWSLSKKIATSDVGASDENGFAVAIDKNGDTLLTGSYTQSSSTGALYVWTAPIAVQLEDTLTLEAGTGITLTTAAGTDTITITGSAAGLDSASTTALIDSAYVQARQTTYDFLDSAEAISLIDSAYVQARQIKYTNADFTDSAYVTTQINSLIGGAPGTLDTLNEIAAALNDDDSAYSTLVGLISAKSDLDSSAAITLIDSAYVQARQTTYDFLDSAEAISLIDSDYVQARVTASSSSVTQSATPPAGPSSGDMWFDTTDATLFVYYTDSDGAQWVDVSGSTAAVTANATQSDTAPSSPTAGDLWFDTTDATLFIYYNDSDGAQWVTVSGPTGPTGATGATGTVDSATTIALIDSAYVQARQSAGGITWQSSILTDSAVSLSAGNGYFIDTTNNPITATLPATASTGDEVILMDYGYTWDSSALTINSNSLKYQGYIDSDIPISPSTFGKAVEYI